MTFPSDLPPPASTPPRRYFGKRPTVDDFRDIWLKSYLDAPRLLDALQAPAMLDWAAFPLPSGAPPAYGRDPLYNNVAGSCVFSMLGQKINLLAQHVGRPDLRVTAEMVAAGYSTTGYDPLTGSGDNGANIREHLLKPGKARGWWGTRTLAYGRVDPRNSQEVALAVALFGGLLGGFNLPRIFDQQRDAHGRYQWTRPEGGWKPGDGPNSQNGHAIYLHAPGSGDTWGECVVMDPPWMADSCDELWFELPDYWQVGDRAPNGFAWQDLVRDAEARAAG